MHQLYKIGGFVGTSPCINLYCKYIYDFSLIHNLQNFLNGIFLLPFLELSILGISRCQLKDGQSTVQNLDSLHRCADTVLALYWWQRLITFVSSRMRLRVKPICWKFVWCLAKFPIVVSNVKFNVQAKIEFAVFFLFTSFVLHICYVVSYLV